MNNPPPYLFPPFIWITSSYPATDSNAYTTEQSNRQQQQLMGDTFSSEKQRQFLENIELFESVQDKNYDKLDIYRMKEPPYSYILDYKKNYIGDNDRTNQYIQLMNQFKNLEHKNLAKVHACCLIEDKQLCIIHKIVHTYCNYYNFTLAQAMLKKKATKNTFSEGDLLYIMQSLIDVIVYLKQYKLAFCQFRAESIYLSPEGHIKVYLLDIDAENKHSCYYKVLSESNKLPEYILAPEQLNSMKKMQYQTKYNVYKADLFAVGMVMLELITLDFAKFYYNESRLQVMINKAIFSLEIYSNKYSKQFLDIVKLCLEYDPANRPNPDEVFTLLEELKNNSKNNVFCIRLEAEENKEKPEQNFGKPKGQYILNSLAKKLNPSPISTISSSSASLFKSSQQRSSSFRGKSNFGTFLKE